MCSRPERVLISETFSGILFSNNSAVQKDLEQPDSPVLACHWYRRRCGLHARNHSVNFNSDIVIVVSRASAKGVSLSQRCRTVCPPLCLAFVRMTDMLDL